jgi:hypothetical protein
MFTASMLGAFGFSRKRRRTLTAKFVSPLRSPFASYSCACLHLDCAVVSHLVVKE